MMKVKMKISGSFRTPEGAPISACLRSLVSTARKHGCTILRTLAAPPRSDPPSPRRISRRLGSYESLSPHRTQGPWLPHRQRRSRARVILKNSNILEPALQDIAEFLAGAPAFRRPSSRTQSPGARVDASTRRWLAKATAGLARLSARPRTGLLPLWAAGGADLRRRLRRLPHSV